MLFRIHHSARVLSNSYVDPTGVGQLKLLAWSTNCLEQLLGAKLVGNKREERVKAMSKVRPVAHDSRSSRCQLKKFDGCFWLLGQQ